MRQGLSMSPVGVVVRIGLLSSAMHSQWKRAIMNSSISQFESNLMTSVSSRGMPNNEHKGIAMKCGGLPFLTMRELSEFSISIMHTDIFISPLESQTMIPQPSLQRDPLKRSTSTQTHK